MYEKTKRYFKGFTLVELLVVVTIIGILSTLVIINLQDSRAKARNAKRKSDLQTIASALEAYYTDFNGYPMGEGGVTKDDEWYAVRNIASSTAADQLDNNQVDQITGTQVQNHTVWKDRYQKGSWLYELTYRGYLDKVPSDPLNELGNTYGLKVIYNNNQPGFVYIYANDEPNYNTCSYVESWDVWRQTGHAQRYKLFVALERPQADRDYLNDGGSINLQTIYSSTGTYAGVDLGLLYEVYSAGASQYIPTKQTITLPDIRTTECY